MLKKLKLFLFTAISLIVIVLTSQSIIFSASPTKIMALGDSITAMGTWRSMLHSKLTAAGYDVKFVGTQGDNEGHGGMLVTNLAKSGDLATWLKSTNPDVVLMHFGTNDCWSSKGTPAILEAYTKLISQMRENNPNMKIIVAKILPMHPSDDLFNDNVISLNSTIDNWATKLSYNKSPITVVDQYTGFDSKTYTSDGVHPNDIGYVKFVDKWFEALNIVLQLMKN